jgi:hypothetical protein
MGAIIAGVSSCVRVLRTGRNKLCGTTKLRGSELALLKQITDFFIADAGALIFRVTPLPVFVFGVTTSMASTVRQFKYST